MKIKRLIISILLIIVLASIFIFSSENGTTSNKTSDAFTSKVIDSVTGITSKKVDKERKNEIILQARFAIRKLAHFTIYFTLGVLSYLLLRTYHIKKSLSLSILFCFIFACSDELHQLFSIGRTARVLDVIIDTIGSLIGIYLTKLTILFASKIKARKKSLINN